ncbi:MULTISPECIES: efflux transporter outer membrane subunit [unclassified Sphingomonas]|uniref:efflux transporter outer membrane subunit n=1 Tax=unclassified Sphingomonas TaxID=196159 RepID=UPI0028641E31|nr:MULTISPECIES: efflux transporter outer membrane subunit [unclassified Sphingomonas]MDR6115351.1 NodT family efflux transporter outer membrane factor (OMF) lipoprotein [Sphingomonas sp. SORGH_AS_0789]MDR6150974.1 NodT family efflux transporter outer membrane factor (OMF) lipoprotein [Sphingomonas sp. SORGH_AS_0742]
MRKQLSLIPLLLLGACTFGPNYAGPPKAIGSAATPPAGFVRADTTLATTAPAVADWWTTLNDPMLTWLEEQALASNPNVAVAQARLKQARSALRLERANQAPNANASATYLHADLPTLNLGGGGEQGGANGNASGGSGGGTSVDFFNLGFDASWEIDLFGGRRRTVEAARASAAAAEANVADAQVSLSADVAQAYIGLRDAQQRLILARDASRMQRDTLNLTLQRFNNGAASQLEVERLRNQVESTDAQILPLSASVETYLNALAILIGEAPGTLDQRLGQPGKVPLPPAQVAVGDPTALLQRRPDIRAAERNLAAQTARIGVAEAAKFPRLNLMGIIGIGGTSLDALTDLDNLVTLGAPMLQWNVLNFGRANARVGQAEGARDEAEAQYRGVVLSALRDAEDALSRFRARRNTVATLARAKASADRSAMLMQQRYRAGTATLIDTLDAERQRVSADQSLSQAVAGLTNDYVALQKALGLGWRAPTGA